MQQRQQGTVYGGGSGAPTGGPPPSPPARTYYPQGNQNGGFGHGAGGRDAESSGSLSGHLLGQGDTSPQRSGTTKAIVILAVVLGVMIIGSLGLAFFAQDWVNQTLGGVFG